MKRSLIALGLVLALISCSSSESSDVDSGNAQVDGSADIGAQKDGTGQVDKAIADTLEPDSRFPATWVGQPCTGVGTSCTEESEEDKCVVGGDWVWPGGYCTMDCDPDPTKDKCPAGTHCEELTETGPNLNICIKNCKVNGFDCRKAEGYVCGQVPGADFGGCVPL